MDSREWDVVVVGGGPAGIAAALSAASMGASTLLLERRGALGGAHTMACSTAAPSATHDRAGRSFGGVYRQLSALVSDLAGECGYEHPNKLHSPDLWRLAYHLLLPQTGVHTALHTEAQDVKLENQRIVSVDLSRIAERSSLRARVYVDASGDGHLAYRAGVPYDSGVSAADVRLMLDLHLIDDAKAQALRHSIGYTQPMSLMFSLAGVDTAQAKAWLFRHPTGQELGVDPTVFRDPIYQVEGMEVGHHGELPLPQHRILFGPLASSDEVLVNMTRIAGRDGSSGDDLTAAALLGYQQVRAMVNVLRRFIPGFGNARLGGIAPEVGVRETRRFRGQYTLTGGDVYLARRCAIRVARGSYPVDIHDPSGTSPGVLRPISGDFYDIPYGCLCPESIENLLFAGRCISADYVANSSARVTGTCMLLGQAAGTAAALAASSGIAVQEVPATSVMRNLMAQGVWLDEP
jgi:hypothetical protein